MAVETPEPSAILGDAAWAPRRSPGGEAALWAGIGLLLAAAVLGGLAVGQRGGMGALVAALLAALGLGASALAFVAALSYRQLSYEHLADRLRINWQGGALDIPYDTIDGIYNGERLGRRTRPRSLTWPGLYAGVDRVRGLPPARFFSTTTEPRALTLVVSGGWTHVLSAQDTDGFAAALVERARAAAEGPPGSAGPSATPAALVPWTAVADPWAARSLGAGLLLLALLMVAVFLLGSPREAAVILPAGGAAVLALNAALGAAVHAREPVLGRMLWLGAALVLLVMLAVGVAGR